MLKPRIIKSANCLICKSYLKNLAKQEYEYIVFDADLKENQQELDSWKISKMPVIQIVDVQDDGTQEMVFQFPPGPYASRHINNKIKALNKEQEKKK